MLKEEKRLLRRCIADKKKMYTNHELATYSTLLLMRYKRTISSKNGVIVKTLSCLL